MSSVIEANIKYLIEQFKQFCKRLGGTVIERTEAERISIGCAIPPGLAGKLKGLHIDKSMKYLTVGIDAEAEHSSSMLTTVEVPEDLAVEVILGDTAVRGDITLTSPGMASGGLVDLRFEKEQPEINQIWLDIIRTPGGEPVRVVVRALKV